jgi:hypothetical protein
VKITFKYRADVALTILLTMLVAPFVQADRWSESEQDIVRLDPRAFHQLPEEIVAELEVQTCKIPQGFEDAAPHNVISGSFAANNQQDWAVLCSRDGVSVIKIFWGGETSCPSEIAGSHDRNWLQDIGNNRIGFSRVIAPASKQTILDHHKAYGGPTPPPISHQGIDDYFLGKASVVHYCRDGQWIALTGAD